MARRLSAQVEAQQEVVLTHEEFWRRWCFRVHLNQSEQAHTLEAVSRAAEGLSAAGA